MPAEISTVQEIMSDFATLTGLAGAAEPRRYLWTDAFAVCNYLELYRQTGDRQFWQLALQLVEQVHQQLGRHRQDDPRSGWLSGLTGPEAESHPTIGGLLIGKELPERRPDERYDRQLEWEREGQYYHYLTKWMHALNRVSQVGGDPRYNRWARELAQAAHAAFVYEAEGTGQKRMYWKMSIDLSRPLVPSMGQHDPLDGYLTYLSLQETAAGREEAGPDLSAEIADMAAMVADNSWVTDDPLGLGGLLTDAYRAARLLDAGALQLRSLPTRLLDDALVGLQSYNRQGVLRYPVSRRLAFRELGLSIGLHAVAHLRRVTAEEGQYPGRQGMLTRRLQSLQPYLPLAETIESYWLEPAQRRASTWLDHQEINMVMLATSLAPTSYLTVLKHG